jgi:hypothetical protein
MRLHTVVPVHAGVDHSNPRRRSVGARAHLFLSSRYVEQVSMPACCFLVPWRCREGRGCCRGGVTAACRSNTSTSRRAVRPRTERMPPSGVCRVHDDWGRKPWSTCAQCANERVWITLSERTELLVLRPRRGPRERRGGGCGVGGAGRGRGGLEESSEGPHAAAGSAGDVASPRTVSNLDRGVTRERGSDTTAPNSNGDAPYTGLTSPGSSRRSPGPRR